MKQTRTALLAKCVPLALLALVAGMAGGGCTRVRERFARRTPPPASVAQSARQNADAHYRLGRNYLERSRHRNAAAEFSKALAVDPDNTKALNALGVSLDALGRYADAVAAYTRALEIDPGLDYVLNNLGYSHLLSGDRAAAAAAFARALELNPGNTVASNNLSRLQRGGEQAVVPAAPEPEISVAPVPAVASAPDPAVVPVQAAVASNPIVTPEPATPAPVQPAVATPAAKTPAVVPVQAAVAPKAVVTPVPATPAPAVAAPVQPAVATPAAKSPGVVPMQAAVAPKAVVTPVPATPAPAVAAPVQPAVATPAAKTPAGLAPAVVAVRVPVPAPVQTPVAAPAAATPQAAATARKAAPAMLLVPVSSSREGAVLLRRVSSADLRRETVIEISDGSNQAQLLAEIVVFLAAEGYRVEIGPAQPLRGKTMILYQNGALQPAWQVAKSFPGDQEMKKTDVFASPAATVRVLLGRDMVARRSSFAVIAGERLAGTSRR